MLADLRCPSADVQTAAGVTGQCRHLQEEPRTSSCMVPSDRVKEVVEVKEW